MLGRGPAQKPVPVAEPVKPSATAAVVTLLTVVGEVADSLHVECAIGGELTVGGELVIGENGVVNTK
jgi:cytoskeletal protein CcmA (bactofilin family)